MSLRPLSVAREVRELLGDASGQLATEWVLLSFVALPFMMWAGWSCQMLVYYFYRITGVLCLPFP